MTDYELAELFTQNFALIQDQFINYATVLFAFLVSGYLIASKLSAAMTTIIVAIFTGFAFDSISIIWFICNDVVSLQEIMHERVSAGSTELAFHAAARPEFNTNNLTAFTLIRVLTAIGAYIGALVFFFHQRRSGRGGNST